MADQPEYQSKQAVEESNLEEHDGAPVDPLQYPQIFLETSFDSLLQHSYSSTDTPTPTTMAKSSTSPGKGLSESWASISDAGDELLSEQTDVESLVDVKRTDDLLSVQEEESSDDEEEEEEEFPAPQKPQDDIDNGLPAAEKSITESTLFFKYLVLDEPNSAADSQTVDIKYTLRTFSTQESQDLTPQETDSELVGVVALSLNKLSLKDSGRENLRLVLLGKDYLRSVRSSILNKVGDALITSGRPFSGSQSSSPSRYHIVPDCFGPGSTPSIAEVIPIGCQLEVESYHSVEGNAGAIVLVDEESGKKLDSNLYSKSLPYDLAIIVTDGGYDSEALHSLESFRGFVQDHAIPSLEITMDDSWRFAQSYTPSTGHAHRAITSRPVWQGDDLATLPLDLDTFLNLDAGQLSRHLCWLLDHTGDKQGRSVGLVDHFNLDYAKDTFSRVVSYARTMSAANAFTGLLVITFMLQFVLWALPPGHEFGTKHNALSETKVPVMGDVTRQLWSSGATPISTAPVSVQATASLIPLTIDAAKSTSGKFEIEVIGSSHLIVRTPHKAKGRAPLKVNVSREDTLIASDLKMLFPCVYSIEISKEDLHGEISVKLEMPNPRLSDIIKLDLGPEPIDAWVRRIAKDTEHKVQKWLSDVHDYFDSLNGPERRQRRATRAKKAEEWASNVLKNVTELQQRMLQPVDRLRRTFNARVDAAGVAYAERFNHKLIRQKSNARRLSKDAAALLCRGKCAIKQKWVSLKATGQGMRGMAQSMRQARRSKTLAIAQGRVQDILANRRQKKQMKGRN